MAATKVLDVLTPDKWAKNPRYSQREEVCLGLALNRVYPPGPVNRVAWERVQEAIRVLYPERPTAVSLFNDHPDTTWEDVERVCKVADV